MNINSKEYWDERFDTNWLDFAGDKQTLFFANLLCDMLPQNLVNEIRENEYSVCDMGCALGEGVPVYCRKLSVDIEGMDFSEEAIRQATENYPDHRFWVGDLTNLDTKKVYDVVICSNVLEHFINPWKIVKNLAAVAEKYMIIMVPYKEKLKIEEHMYHFSEENIPIKISDFTLIYVDTVDGNDYSDCFYPDQQILLIYKKNCENMTLLSDISRGAVKCEKRNALKVLKAETDKMSLEIKKWKEIIEEKNIECDSLKEIIQSKDKEIDSLNEAIKERDCDFQKKQGEIEVELQKILTELQELSGIKDENSQNIASVEAFKQSIQQKEDTILAARTLCLTMNAKTSYKIMCTFTRFIKQFICGSFSEKKKFLGICKRSITGERSEFTGNDGYNMLLNIVNILDSSNSVPVTNVRLSSHNEQLESPALQAGQPINPNSLDKYTFECLQRKYDKPDVIIFSVIDYEFRYQRPQHFASRFAQNGHRVFYINANFVNQDGIKEVAPNLNVVNFHNTNCNAIYYAPECVGYEAWFEKKMDDLIYHNAVQDAMLILDYPNWVDGAEYLRHKYGFKITVDYMDDFTGFLGTTTNVLKENCIKLLTISDMVVASSNFLHDIAEKYARNITIVRNGTEVEHFYKAKEMEHHKERPVVGYYGAVSHWFDWEKVCYVAEKMPQVDVVIIGEVTEYREKLEKYKNIKLLGEKKYDELPKHLAYFDVCLIPFDTSTDLIKATNPVKFYEYLSAGKRIVATEIPELEPYRDEYVYMSNDNDQFLKYVKDCLEHSDDLKDVESCVAFAKENDWQKRYEKFAEACKEAAPRVSIVVLTYNNLELNKFCIESILEKTAYPNYELIVLDNGSIDGTVEYLNEVNERKDPRVKIIINPENSGFAGGNNIAIDQATGEFIMLLNNDTVITKGWLTNAVKHMENDPKCGMCGAVTNSIGNEAMIGVNYKNLKELASFAFQYTRIHNNETYTDVDRLAMFCTLIRKDIMDKYGKLDANYQVGMFEDDDYAQVVKSAGYKLIIAEDVFVHHVNNASFKKLQSEEYKKIFEKNKKLFEEKWGVKWKMPKYRDGVTAVVNEGMMVEPKER